MTTELASTLSAAAAPSAGPAELAALVTAARDHDTPLASLITTFATRPPAAQEAAQLRWHEVIAEPHVSPGAESWSACVELLDTLGGEPELFSVLAKLLDAHQWPAWTRQVTAGWAERFLDPECEHGALALFRGLDFDAAKVEPEAFARTPHACHLTHLRIALDFIADAWRTIASNQHLDGLSHLILHGGLEQVPTLLLAAQLPALRFLDLASCELEDEAIEALASRGVLQRLQHLDLGHNPDWGTNELSSRGLAAIAASAPALRYLDLSGNDAIDDEGVVALCSASCAAQLATLHLSGVRLRAEAFDALASLPRLEVLTLGAISSSDIQRLGAGDGLRRLRGLSVWPSESDESPEQRRAAIERLHAALPALEVFQS